jgi:6-pyruvoyltetrahydropterin/6-carboxytetrahydropterin synthase
MKVSVFRRADFCAAHRLYNQDWDAVRNEKLFGLCANPNYHGHNYTLEARVTGDIDPETGYVFDMKILRDMIDEQIIEPFDHRNFNLDVPEFKTLNPTAENIAVVIWKKLRSQIGPQFELHVRLYETERNFVEYWGE